MFDWQRTALNILVVALLTTIACGSEESLVKDPSISVIPTQITFDSVLMGSMDTKLLTIRNEGEGNLVIDEIVVDGDPTGDLRLLTGFTDILTIEPGRDHVVSVIYEPTQAALLDADVVIHSNDRDHREYRVPVGTPGLFPFISVNPAVVDFGQITEGSQSTIEVVLTNRGTAPLVIRDMELGGSADFSVPELEELDYPITLDVWLPEGDGGESSLTFDVTYNPPSPGADEGVIIITYNSADSTTFNLQLLGEGGLPAILVSPNPIDFGFSPLGITKDVTVTVTNMGDDAVELQQISFEVGTSDTFELGQLPPELQTSDGGILLDGRRGGDFGGQVPFTISYTPLTETSHGGRVLVSTSISVTPVLVTGVGVDNRCPVAVARGFIRDDPQQRRDTNIDWATPTDILILDGGGSFDPDGEIVSYAWEMTRSPEGTTTALRPLEGFESDESRRQFFIPLSGRYEFMLRVFDDVGFQDCDTPATVTVIALPDELIHIELQWHNPLDFDETDDEGADVDLHLVKVGHNWFDGTYDTYYANESPSWSPELPSLDIDDTDGRGPENIQMDNPLDCQWYAVGAHYFERQFGTAYADVRIFIDGVQIRQLINRPLENTDDFWDVGRLHWPSGEFFIVDDIYTSFDSHSAIPPSVTPEMAESVAGQCD